MTKNQQRVMGWLAILCVAMVIVLTVVFILLGERITAKYERSAILEWRYYDWECIPFKDHFVLSTKPRIEVYFLHQTDWERAAKKFYPNDDPQSMSGFIIHYANGLYEIYVPREKDWTTGEIYEDVLGHEIMHILWWEWHHGQTQIPERAQ